MIWCVEYSPVQKAFHVDTLDRILETNRQTVEQGLAPGYVPLCAVSSLEDAHAFLQQWRCGHGS